MTWVGTGVAHHSTTALPIVSAGTNTIMCLLIAELIAKTMVIGNALYAFMVCYKAVSPIGTVFISVTSVYALVVFTKSPIGTIPVISASRHTLLVGANETQVTIRIPLAASYTMVIRTYLTRWAIGAFLATVHTQLGLFITE